MRKIISIMLILSMVLMLFSGCSEAGVGEQIIFPIDRDPEYLDPQIASGTGASCIVANCFEGLVAFDENMNIIPAAAESFDVSPDSLIYTFHLRKNMNWLITTIGSKILGDEAKTFDTSITAKDFAFGIKRAIIAQTNSPAALHLMCIKNASKFSLGEVDESKLGVCVKDDYTLEIELERPDSNFLITLTTPGCMPCDEAYFEKTGGRYGLTTEYLIYNGPFYISRWNEGVAITARKNDTYHSNNTVKPSSVYFSINNEQETRSKKVIEGTYEVAPVTSSQFKELSAEKDITFKSFNNCVYGLMFNCSDELLKSNSLRKALALTFSSDIIYSQSEIKTAKGIVPSASLVGNNSFRSAAAAVKFSSKNKNAAKLYYELAVDKLNLKDVELTVLCSLNDETAVRAVMQQWQSTFGVNFSISVEAVEDSVLNERVETGDYQLAFSSIKFDGTTALNALTSFCSGNANNLVNLNSKKYDRMIEAVKKTKSESAHIKALEKAESYLVDNAVFIPICESETYYAFAKGVEGISFSPTGDVLYFKNAISK